MLTSVIHQKLSSLCTRYSTLSVNNTWPTSNCSRLSIRPTCTILSLLSRLMSNRCPDITYVDCHGNSHWGHKQSKLFDVRPPLLAQSPCWPLRIVSVTQLRAGYRWLTNAAGTCRHRSSIVCLEYMAGNAKDSVAKKHFRMNVIWYTSHVYYRCRYYFENKLISQTLSVRRE